MVEYVENMMKNMRTEVELNKSAVNAVISSAKEDILGDQNSLKADLIRRMDANALNLKGEIGEKRKELYGDMELQKKMLIERMNEMNEATKSLSRALVLKEAAGRAKEDEHIIKLFDRKIGNLDKYFSRLLGATETKLRIEFDKKLEDFTLLYGEFRLWVISEFSNVRTEAEEFKQEFYTREFNEYLLNLAFQADVSDAFTEVRQEFRKNNVVIEDLKEKISNDNNELLKKLEEEKTGRLQEDESIREQVQENLDEFNKYKDLNENTWQSYIDEVDARFYLNALQSETIEDNIFFQMTNLLSDIGNLGGNFEDLTAKLNNLTNNVTEFKGEFGEE